MKDLNKHTEWVYTSMDNCLLNLQTSEDVINDFLTDENGNDWHYPNGKNLKEIFVNAMESDSAKVNDIEDLMTALHSQGVYTKEEYIKNFFKKYELDEEDETMCSISEIAFMRTLDQDTAEYFKLLDDGYTELAYEIAALLAEYATEEYGGEWDYWWTEGHYYAYNKAYWEIKDGGFHQIVDLDEL